MPTTGPEPLTLEEARSTLAILHQLGASIRLSLEAATQESLPEEMGLLLLRLALAEVLERAAEEEAREAEPPGEEWVVGLRRWAAISARAAWDDATSHEPTR